MYRGGIGGDQASARAEARARPAQSAHDSDAVLKVLLDYLPIAVSIFGPDLQMIACNAKLRQLLDLPDELFAKGLPSLPTLLQFSALRGDYGPGEVEELCRAALEDARAASPRVFERTRADGTVLEIRRIPLSGGGFLNIHTDITERRQTEKALQESEAELRLLTDNVPAMILYVDRNMRCVFANRRYADFFGIGMCDLVGKHLHEIVGDAAYPWVEEHFRQALEGRSVAYQRLVRLKNGEERCIEVKLVPRTAEQGRIAGCYSMAIDITEQKRAAERIEYVAHHDSLTGLPNRLLFNDRLGQAISLAKRTSRQFALLYVDLDKFKPVNDTLGHNIGDDLLRDAADRLRLQVRESDTVARVGGDEFTVILRDVASRQDAATVAEKIIAALATPFLAGGKHSVEIGASIGIALYPGDSHDHETLIKVADAAMYAAKLRGGCYRFFRS